MIGVVVATHGKLAEEMIRTAEAVVGPLERVVPLSVVATSPDLRGDLKAAIGRVDQGDGVLLLTDLLGGSPTNLCVSFLAERQVEVVTGVNLPMLMKLAHIRDKNDLREAALALKQSGQKGIAVASEVLKKK